MHSIGVDSNGKGIVKLTGHIAKVLVNGVEWGPVEALSRKPATDQSDEVRS